MRRAVLLLLALGIVSFTSAQSLTFSQIDWEVGPNVVANSEWGSAVIDYTGYADVMYLNVNVNGSWSIKNMPLVSSYGEGIRDVLNLSFDLGTSRGQDVSSLDYGFTITPDLASMPSITGTALVQDRTYSHDYGIGDGAQPGDPVPAPPAAEGDKVKRIAKHKADVPNQEANKGECAPAAASNSLMYLKKQGKITVDDDKISIATFKRELKFGQGQTYCPSDWQPLKKAYLARIGLNVTTEVVPYDQLDKVFDEINADCDVEMDGFDRVKKVGHTAAVQTIFEDEDGDIMVDVRQDTNQLGAGGTEPTEENQRVIIFDNKISGAMYGDLPFKNFTIECPVPEPGGFLAFGAAIGAFGLKRRKSGGASR